MSTHLRNAGQLRRALTLSSLGDGHLIVDRVHGEIISVSLLRIHLRECGGLLALRNTTLRHVLDSLLLLAGLVHAFKLLLHSALLPLRGSLGGVRFLGPGWLLCGQLGCECAFFLSLFKLVILLGLVSLVDLFLGEAIETLVGWG